MCLCLLTQVELECKSNHVEKPQVLQVGFPSDLLPYPTGVPLNRNHRCQSQMLLPIVRYTRNTDNLLEYVIRTADAQKGAGVEETTSNTQYTAPTKISVPYPDSAKPIHLFPNILELVQVRWSLSLWSKSQSHKNSCVCVGVFFPSFWEEGVPGGGGAIVSSYLDSIGEAGKNSLAAQRSSLRSAMKEKKISTAYLR